jgi:hypothetical protein
LAPFKPQPDEVAPKGYVSYLETAAFQAREVQGNRHARFLSGGKIWGARAILGPLVFDRYMGDEEPVLEPGGPLRLVMWQPIRLLTAPAGWKESRLVERKNTTGIADVQPTGDYMKDWTSHAKRHTKAWRKERDNWIIEPINYDQFEIAYKKAKIDPILKLAFKSLLRQKIKSHGGLMHIVGARRAHSTVYEAGFAYLHIPEVQQMYHTISFIAPSAKDTEVGYGLMDYWFEHAQRIGVTKLDFGVFWTPGDPPSWKGFSRFKSQFGVKIIYYPRAFVRMAGSLRHTLRHGTHT